MANKNFKMSASACAALITTGIVVIISDKSFGHGANLLENLFIAVSWGLYIAIIFAMAFAGWFIIMRIWQGIFPNSFMSAKNKFFQFLNWRNFF